MYWKDYYPNYKKLYPDEEITPEVLKTLRKTDRQFQRFDYDLKRKRPVYRNESTGAPAKQGDPGAILVDFEQGREVSLDMLLESGEKTFDYAVNEYGDPLNVVLAKERNDELYRCLALLNNEEHRLVDALFFVGMTETEYANSIGRRQSSVNERKKVILKKIRKNYWNQSDNLPVLTP